MVICFAALGSQGGQRGAGFCMQKKISGKLTAFVGISDRVVLTSFNFGKEKLTIIQAYAPTVASDIRDCDQFFKTTNKTSSTVKSNVANQLLVIADFNSQVGADKKGEHQIIGKYTFGKRNIRGDRQVHFCQAYNFKIVNTSFKKGQGKRWTWPAPNQAFKLQIDFFLAPSTTFSNETNCDTLNNFQFHSDHRPVFCKIEIKKTRYKPTVKTFMLGINKNNKEEYQSKLN